MANLRNLTFWFPIKSSCCSNNAVESSTTPGLSCQNSPLNVVTSRYSNIMLTNHKLLMQLADLGIKMYATTITIHCKWLGCKSYQDQYRYLKNMIKRREDQDTWYVYHFELQKNGNLHAHGVIAYLKSTSEWGLKYKEIGIRNAHQQACQEIKHIRNYLEYINKENICMPITNIRRNQLTVEIENLIQYQDQNKPVVQTMGAGES